MKAFDLKKIVETEEMWKEFKFSVEYSKSGVARIYVNSRKTKYYAGGFGYDKESAVIAQMINDLLGERKYNKSVYGSNGVKLDQCGVGIDSIINSLETIGVKLEQIYFGRNYNVYNINLKNIKE